MNGKSKFSFDLNSLPYKNKQSSAKVDIKSICQKFENLSSATERNSNSFDDNSTPIPPVRRRKSNSSLNNVHSNDTIRERAASTPFTNNTYRNSVKEKTKLFESPDADKNSITSSTKKIDHVTQQSSVLLEESRKTCNSEIKNFDHKFPVYVNTPPAKPPRSFAHEQSENKNVKELPVMSDLSTVIKKSKILNSNGCKESSVLKESVISNSVKTPKFTDISENDIKSTPTSAFKAQKSSGKTQAILNYFKNISETANNICEKVKQKPFVDLTPTTVSPPKHYGTLKRSLSEEHIYAEPIALSKRSNNSPKENNKQLHYMYTSVIPPEVPNRPNSLNTFTSGESVRSMIYGSFASLRLSLKENSENSTNVPVIDNCEVDLSRKAIEARIIYVKSVRKQVSTSSLCLAPKLYEVLHIVNVEDDQPSLTYSFPLKVPGEFKFPLLPHICFPDSSLQKCSSIYQSETFNFILIDKDETVFGYCLRIQGWPEASSLCVKLPVAICILSRFNAPVFYKKLLLEVEKHLTLPRNKCFKYIRSLQKLGVPNAGASLSIPDCTENEDNSDRIIISRPLDSHFVGLEMTRALQLLDVDILIKCVASLFLERRILFFSSNTSNLYQCCKAITSLLYPFEWPHLIIPVLPACLTVHCCSEQPYILGIIKNNCDSVLELLAEHELLIIDIDKGAIIKACHDEDTILPKKVQKAVTSALNLAKNMTDPTEMLRDIMISEAFVHMSVEMIGHYENHFVDVNGNIVFQKENFLKNAFSHNIRSFLQWFSETQMFDAFIEESLWRMKYRNICQTNMRTFFEKRVDEYKWELSHGGEKLSRIIGKTVRNFGEMLKGLKKNP